LIEVKRNSNSLRKLTGNRETTAFGKREGEKYGEGGDDQINQKTSCLKILRISRCKIVKRRINNLR